MTSRAVWLLAVILSISQQCFGREVSEAMRRAIEAAETQARSDAKQISEVLEKRVVGVYAGHIVTEYLENVVAADDRYKDKLVVVRGEVNRVDKQEDGTPYMIVVAPDWFQCLASTTTSLSAATRKSTNPF